MSDQEGTLNDLQASVLRAFMVPPHLLGVRVEPETREDAVRERLAYIDLAGLDPFSVNDPDVELVVSAEGLWAAGVIDGTDARRMLAPLQQAPTQWGGAR